MRLHNNSLILSVCVLETHAVPDNCPRKYVQIEPIDSLKYLHSNQTQTGTCF